MQLISPDMSPLAEKEICNIKERVCVERMSRENDVPSDHPPPRSRKAVQLELQSVFDGQKRTTT